MVSDHGELHLHYGTASHSNEHSAPLRALSWVSVCFSVRGAVRLTKWMWLSLGLYEKLEQSPKRSKIS